MTEPTDDESGFFGDAVRWQVREDIVDVELCRNPCNEIGSVFLQELERLIAFIGRGACGARALVIHSSRERGFSAGADLRELLSGMTSARSEARVMTDARAFVKRIHTAFDALDATPLVTVSAVHGFCFGGGLELALTTDIIVADASARFCFPELRLGLIPGFGGIPRLRRNVGQSVACDLLLTGRSIGAARAHALGLVAQLVGRGQALETARAVATQSARFAPEVVRTAKAFIKRIPKAELAAERKLFLDLLASPRVESALAEFATRTDVLPYLPSRPP